MKGLRIAGRGLRISGPRFNLPSETYNLSLKGAWMETQFRTVADEEALEQLFARSHEGPVVLFKHSNTCPISAMAYSRMKQLSEGVSLLVVQQSRELSRRVETRTGVAHESPQVLVLRRGRTVWTASHFEITAEAVAQAVKENQ